MPESTVGADGEGFEASIGILSHEWSIDGVQIRGLAPGSPTAPCAVQSHLVDMPECSIGPNGEGFESSIDILSHGGTCLDSCCGFAQRGPIGLYHSVSFPLCVSWTCMKKYASVCTANYIIQYAQ